MAPTDMLKPIWTIWLLWLAVLSSLAQGGGTAGIPDCAVHCLQSVRTLSFDYDRRIQAHINYDGSSKGIFDYDGAEVHTVNECAKQSASSRTLFAVFAKFLAAEGTGTAARFIVSDSGQVLDTSAITIPGPVNSAFGKIDYLLGNVTTGDSAALSAGKGGFFSGVMGYDQTTLGPALQNQLIDNFGSATINGNRISVVGPMTGPSGTTANVLSAWQVTPSGSVSFITAFPK